MSGIHWCGEVARPCPHGDCFWHLAGTESCTLDVTDRGGVAPEEVAAAMGITSKQENAIFLSASRKLTSDHDEYAARAKARRGLTLVPLSEQKRPRKCSTCLQHGHDYRTCTQGAQ